MNASGVCQQLQPTYLRWSNSGPERCLCHKCRAPYSPAEPLAGMGFGCCSAFGFPFFPACLPDGHPYSSCNCSSLQDKRRLEETIAELLQDNERMHNDLSRSPYRPPAHLQLPGTSLCDTAVLLLGCGLQRCRQQLPGPCSGFRRSHLQTAPEPCSWLGCWVIMAL